ncbi:MAG: formylglycine-generating enzyme family protein [Calditrichaeota bacterium]|nr:formylglycine-generating enzyme family protein [Calditrichota bacterium]
MRTLSHFSTFILLYFLTFTLISCDVLSPPSEIEWANNPLDGRNPDAVPEIISIEFKSKSSTNDPARIAINTRGASEIRFSKVNQTGDPLSSSYQPVQLEYQLDLSFGDNIIAAQVKAQNGNESPVHYQTVTIEKGRVFPLGNTGENILMCWIPAGEFEMGSPDVEEDRNDSEGPEHDVTFENGFWMGKYEVTQGQWEAVIGGIPSRAYDYGEGEDHPVYYKSWNAIQVFISGLNNAFRLPSESEWEYACRAGTDTRFYWGNDPDYEDIDDYAWYWGNSDQLTHEVGQKRPNAWGLYDMSGNVWESCEDWYHVDYTNAPNDGSAWVLPSGYLRVNRGGGWDSYDEFCRSAVRGGTQDVVRYNFLGFRLARDAD